MFKYILTKIFRFQQSHNSIRIFLNEEELHGSARRDQYSTIIDDKRYNEYKIEGGMLKWSKTISGDYSESSKLEQEEVKLVAEGNKAKIYDYFKAKCKQIQNKTRNRLLDEAYLLARLSSDYVVKHIGIMDTGYEYVMEIWGSALKLCQRSATDLIFYFLDIARGVKFIHDSGYVHLDLNLRNILIKAGRLKIGDFSLAKKIGERIGYCGTIGYMAPEVRLRECTDGNAADIYSIGEVFNQLSDAKEFEDLIRSCKNITSENRLDLDEVVDKLVVIRENIRVERREPKVEECNQIVVPSTDASKSSFG